MSYTSEVGDQEQHMYMQLDPNLNPIMTGGWKFSHPDGERRELTYTADTNGFVPKADYLPKQVEPLVANDLATVKAKKDFRCVN